MNDVPTAGPVPPPPPPPPQGPLAPPTPVWRTTTLVLVGALLAAAGAVVAVNLTDGDEGDGVMPPPSSMIASVAGPATSSGTTATAVTAPVTVTAVQPQPPRQPDVLAFPTIGSISATAVRANSSDSCGNPTAYQPAYASDGQRDTAWMAPGDGTGQSLMITLTGRSLVTTVGLVPGYDKFDPCTQTDRYFELRRVMTVRWTFDDGTELVQNLDPGSPAMQTVTLVRGIETTTIRMTILATTAPGVARLDHTPVSEIEVS